MSADQSKCSPVRVSASSLPLSAPDAVPAESGGLDRALNTLLTLLDNCEFNGALNKATADLLKSQARGVAAARDAEHAAALDRVRAEERERALNDALNAVAEIGQWKSLARSYRIDPVLMSVAKDQAVRAVGMLRAPDRAARLAREADGEADR